MVCVCYLCACVSMCVRCKGLRCSRHVFKYARQYFMGHSYAGDDEEDNESVDHRNNGRGQCQNDL